MSQEGEAVSSSICISIPIPQQGINRLFLAAPLGGKVAYEAKYVEQWEKQKAGQLHQDKSNAGMTAVDGYEAGGDVLTGFLISDGRQAGIF